MQMQNDKTSNTTCFSVAVCEQKAERTALPGHAAPRRSAAAPQV